MKNFIFASLLVTMGGGISPSAWSQSALDDPTRIDVPAGAEVMLPVGDTIEEVQLGENASLVLPSFKSIHIQKIVSKGAGARIRFLQQSSGGDGVNGRTGGDGAEVRVFLDNVEGSVLIEARGGSGLAGRHGRNGRQGHDGKSGRDARTLIFGLFYLGNGENGQDGQPGENGEDGTDGGNGGRGGAVQVYYEKKSQGAQIVVDTNGGAGGDPGRGGLGGLGGNGGRAGRGLRYGRPGFQGVNGRAGRAGRAGAPGVPGEALVAQVSPAFFRCLSEADALILAGSDPELALAVCPQTSQDAQAVTESEPPQPARAFLSQTAGFSGDGDIHLDANGDDGADAAPVFGYGTSALAGAPGSPGGRVTYLFHAIPDGGVQISARGGNGGRGASGYAGAPGGTGADGAKADLFTKSRPGEDGGDGGSGGDGSHGGAGGDGGSVRIVLVTETEDEAPDGWRDYFSCDVSGGSGGDAGMGGRGGKGGKGGRGGAAWRVGKRQSDGRNGVDGASGKDGKSGTSGQSGVVEYFEVRSEAEWVLREFRRFSLEYSGSSRENLSEVSAKI